MTSLATTFHDSCIYLDDAFPLNAHCRTPRFLKNTMLAKITRVAQFSVKFLPVVGKGKPKVMSRGPQSDRAGVHGYLAGSVWSLVGFCENSPPPGPPPSFTD